MRPSIPAAATRALEDLAAQVHHDLERLAYPAPEWVRPHRHPTGQHVWDVVIVGGGQSGLSAAFGLIREKVGNILVIDENPEGREGPWVTYARMVTLRTPKYLTGPDLGIASLTFRAWWEAQFGSAAWNSMDKIPREEWMRYLQWFRRTLDLPVRNETRLDLIEPIEGGLFRLCISGPGCATGESLLARKVVLATGIQGGGEWHVPSFISDALPAGSYTHTSTMVDYTAYRGGRIGILGGGASAFDNAQFALGAGVKEAHVFIRRPELPRVNPIRYMESAGFLRHFADLDDDAKYRAISHFLNHSQPPTNDTFNRAASYPGFVLHLSAPWQRAEKIGESVRVTTPQGSYEFDLVVLSTGLLTDVSLRHELRLVAGDIARWRDRYTPPEERRHPLVDDHPYLGPSFEFEPRVPEAAARLYGLFAFNYSALASLGLSAAALTGMKFATPRLVAGITGQLFMDDREAILGGYYAYDAEEFVGTWPSP